MRLAFDLVAPDAEWALHCTLAVNDRNATWWTVLARRGEPLLLVRDESLSRPKRGLLEVRGPGLWADVHCHEPQQRWQVNFEGITLALDPSDVGRNEVGDLVPVEFEFDWEATQIRGGSVQTCMVDGEAQIGDHLLRLDAPTGGTWTHAW